MTAVLGILNKQAVAIAADSAVTISTPKGRKISNTANKIFKLSRSSPIGIAIYSSSTYMRTPWEIIVNSYQKKRSGISFELLQDYAKDFIDYVDREFPSTENDDELALIHLLNVVWSSIEANALSENGGLTPQNVKSFIVLLVKILQKHIDDFVKTLCYTSFTDYTEEMFDQQYGMIINEFYKQLLEHRKLLNELIETTSFFQQLRKLIYLLIVSPNKLQESSGIVFVGYGESEYFPSLVAIDVSFAFASRMRYLLLQNETITKDVDAAIYPFAQHDVIDTIIQGIEPSLEIQYFDNTMKALKQVQEAIASKIDSQDSVLAEQVRKVNITSILQNLQAANDNIKNRKYIAPLLETISSFSKEELASMAESMIELTALKRKMTFEEESVGGPVDVAVISKSDGFVWIHRKHYFDKELNLDYLLNKSKSYDDK